MSRTTRTRILIIAASAVFTVAIHYGWLTDKLFGHVHWVHAVHTRFCYVPIIIAAAWFGLRGGLYTATLISLLVFPLIARLDVDSNQFASEIADVVFYYGMGVLIGVLVDRQSAAQRSKEAAQRQVEQSQKLSVVGQMAAGVAHEIKNPLASIKGAADILADENTSPEERAEFKDILVNEVRRMDTTVGEFLEFARPREARLRRTNLCDIVRQSVRRIESQAHQDGISVVYDGAQELYVNGDVEKLTQLVLNFLLNALQASSPGSKVTVTVRERDTRVELSVTDEGEGIKKEDMERIFEPFYTTKHSGTGLGLAVVRAIIESHDGELSVESEYGKGTAMTVSLPVWDERNA